MIAARKMAAVAAGGLAVFLAIASQQPEEIPLPPAPAPGLTLTGLFTGPTASDDALIFGELCEQLAEVVRWDGEQEKPRLATGAAIDDLRRLAREYRLDGESVGARQPRAADAIANYMTEKLGTDGGPITPAKRAAWVDCFLAIAGACRAAVAL
jgi:hypothetical protein